MKSEEEEVTLSFEEIEVIIGSPLPKTAYVYDTWWSNPSENSAQSKPWLGANYLVTGISTTIKKRYVCFVKMKEDKCINAEDKTLKGFKYLSLKKFLMSQEEVQVILSFEEIENIIGFALPKSATTYNAWWSNTTGNLSQAKSWLETNYRVEGISMTRPKGFVKFIKQ